MRKIIRIVIVLLTVVLAIIAVAVVVMLVSGGRVMKTAVNQFGPQMLGVPVTLKDATLFPLRGKAELKGLHVGNPDGFHTPSLLDVDVVSIDLDTLSIFTDTIHVRRVEINNPQFTYEKSIGSSNIRMLQDRLGGTKTKAAAGAQPAAPPPAAAPAPSKPAAEKPQGKKVVIDELIIRDPKLNASLTALNGHYLILSLGQIDIKDIGKEKGGVTFQDAIKIILTAVLGNIDQAVHGATDVVKSAAKELKKSSGGLFDALKDAFSGGHKDKKNKPETPQPPEPAGSQTNQAAPQAGQPQPTNDTDP